MVTVLILTCPTCNADRSTTAISKLICLYSVQCVHLSMHTVEGARVGYIYTLCIGRVEVVLD